MVHDNDIKHCTIEGIRSYVTLVYMQLYNKDHCIELFQIPKKEYQKTQEKKIAPRFRMKKEKKRQTDQ